jgi:hypothetical protein
MGTKALKPLAKEENEGEKPLQFWFYMRMLNEIVVCWNLNI